jgi:hypothetical protein
MSGLSPYALVKDGKVVRWCDDIMLPSHLPAEDATYRILPVVEGERPPTAPGERVHGPNYDVLPDMVLAWYWVEPT